MRSVSLFCLLMLPLPASGQSCSVQVTDVNFDRYNFLTTSPTTANGKVTLNCNPSVPSALVTVSPGTSGMASDRFMMSGSYKLKYNIYADPGYTQIAGDGTNGTVPLIRSESSPTTAGYYIYGRIPPDQVVGAGGYTDMMTVTVTW